MSPGSAMDVFERFYVFQRFFQEGNATIHGAASHQPLFEVYPLPVYHALLNLASQVKEKTLPSDGDLPVAELWLHHAPATDRVWQVRAGHGRYFP